MWAGGLWGIKKNILFWLFFKVRDIAPNDFIWENFLLATPFDTNLRQVDVDQSLFGKFKQEIHGWDTVTPVKTSKEGQFKCHLEKIYGQVSLGLDETGKCIVTFGM